MEFIESMINYIQNHGVEPSVSLLLVVIAAVHILEERIKNFRRFVNQEWFLPGKENFPITKLEALVKDQIGLFAALTLLSLAGVLNVKFILPVVGFVTADAIQHFAFSIGRRKYTPGAASSVFYALYTGYFGFFVLPGLPIEAGSIVGFMSLGAGFLMLNYVMISRRARKSRSLPKLRIQA